MLAVDPQSSEIARRRAEVNLAPEKLQRIAAEADASAARARLSDPEAQYDDAKRSNVRMQE